MPLRWASLVPCAGFSDFDFIGFSRGWLLREIKHLREAEVTHGRISMLASLGFLVGENFHPLFGFDGKEALGTKVVTEVRQVFLEFFEHLAIPTGILAKHKALVNGSPTFSSPITTPETLGSTPLASSPPTPSSLPRCRLELQYGRLGLLVIAGFVAQVFLGGKPMPLNDFGT